MQLIQEIQEKFQLGSQAAFTLKTGERVSGLLVGIGLDSVTLNLTNGVETILVNNILEVDTPVQDEPEAPNLPDLAQFEKQVFKQLTEIEDQFNTKIQTSRIEKLKQPDRRFPAAEITDWAKTNIMWTWNKIWDKFDEVEKLDDLDAEDNIDWIITTVKSLVRQFPASPSLKRLLAYFYTTSEKWDEALWSYQEAAVQSEVAEHWLDVAVSALKMKKKELACCSLGEFFYGVPILEEQEVWYVYVGLLERFNDLHGFREQCKIDSNDEDEPEFLLKTAIYLLQKIGKETSATEIIRKQLAGESISSLLKEGCQELQGNPTESYQKIFTEFMEALKEDNIYTEGERANEPMKAGISPKQTLVGYDLYREAKRANDNGDLKTAERLYQECIKEKISQRESAIKDLAMVFDRLKRPENGIKLLKENYQTVKDKNAINRLLIALYPKVGEYERAIHLLNNFLKHELNNEKKSQIRWDIANNYIKLGNYKSAQKQLRQVEKLRPDNITVKQNIAFCLAKERRYDLAKSILNRIQDLPSDSDARTGLLLESIGKAEVQGGDFNLDHDDFVQVSSYSSEQTYSSLSYSSELTKFAQFFLERCNNLGIRAARLNEDGKYKPSKKKIVRREMKELEEKAIKAGTASASERSDYFLSAAKICDTEFVDRNFFFQYLCCSFTSRGDASVARSEDLDIAREWYREALIAHDKVISSEIAGQDAAWSLVRYLYTIFGPHKKVPLTSTSGLPDTNKVLEEVILSGQPVQKVFNVITDLVLHSRYAANKILGSLYRDLRLRPLAIDYLKEMGIAVPITIELQKDFIQLWNNLKPKQVNTNIANRLQGLHNAVISHSRLEVNINDVRNIRSDLYPGFDKQRDQQRFGELEQILERALALCDATKAFEQRENLFDDCRNFSERLLSEIEKSPTKLSVEEIDPIVRNIKEKVETYFKELSENLKPELIPKLAKEPDVPTNRERELNVQIAIANEQGRMSPDELNLVRTYAKLTTIEGFSISRRI